MPSPPLGPTLCRCCFGRSGPESDGARRAYEPALHKVVIDTSLSGPCGRPRNGPGASKAKSARAAAPPREGFIGGFMDNESARHASFLNCQESARLAAGRMQDDALDALEALVEEMLACLTRGDFSGVTDADVRFHELIAGGSENHALERAFEQLAPFARTFITLTLPGVDVHDIVLQHRPILAALRAHDADGAAQAARAHQLAVAQLLNTHYPSTADDTSAP